MEAYSEKMRADGGLAETLEDIQLVAVDLRDSIKTLIDLSADRENEMVLDLDAMCGMYRLLASAANIIDRKLEHCIDRARRQQMGVA